MLHVEFYLAIKNEIVILLEMKETEDLREKKINIECFLSCEESRLKIV